MNDWCICSSCWMAAENLCTGGGRLRVMLLVMRLVVTVLGIVVISSANLSVFSSCHLPHPLHG